MIMILPVLGTGCLNAQKLSENDAFDILVKWNGRNLIIIKLKAFPYAVFSSYIQIFFE